MRTVQRIVNEEKYSLSTKENCQVETDIKWESDTYIYERGEFLFTKKNFSKIKYL
jgi:hypothetical protein